MKINYLFIILINFYPFNKNNCETDFLEDYNNENFIEISKDRTNFITFIDLFKKENIEKILELKKNYQNNSIAEEGINTLISSILDKKSEIKTAEKIIDSIKILKNTTSANFIIKNIDILDFLINQINLIKNNISNINKKKNYEEIKLIVKSISSFIEQIKIVEDSIGSNEEKELFNKYIQKIFNNTNLTEDLPYEEFIAIMLFDKIKLIKDEENKIEIWNLIEKFMFNKIDETNKNVIFNTARDWLDELLKLKILIFPSLNYFFNSLKFKIKIQDLISKKYIELLIKNSKNKIKKEAPFRDRSRIKSKKRSYLISYLTSNKKIIIINSIGFSKNLIEKLESIEKVYNSDEGKINNNYIITCPYFNLFYEKNFFESISQENNERAISDLIVLINFLTNKYINNIIPIYSPEFSKNKDFFENGISSISAFLCNQNIESSAKEYINISFGIPEFRYVPLDALKSNFKSNELFYEKIYLDDLAKGSYISPENRTTIVDELINNQQIKNTSAENFHKFINNNLLNLNGIFFESSSYEIKKNTLVTPENKIINLTASPYNIIEIVSLRNDLSKIIDSSDPDFNSENATINNPKLIQILPENPFIIYNLSSMTKEN